MSNFQKHMYVTGGVYLMIFAILTLFKIIEPSSFSAGIAYGTLGLNMLAIPFGIDSEDE